MGPYDLSVVLYLFVVAFVSLFLLNDAIGKRRRESLLTLVIFWAVSAVLVENYSAVRDECRWLVWSHEYKAKVLAQRDSATGELNGTAGVSPAQGTPLCIQSGRFQTFQSRLEEGLVSRFDEALQRHSTHLLVSATF
jgi:hypothetical protein